MNTVMVTEKSEVFQLCDTVREAAFELHRFLRHGHLEKVYERGLLNRLRKLRIEAQAQVSIDVRDEDGASLGNYVADLIVEGKILVEIKACKTLADEHTAQLLGYLRATRFEHGLLINFGAPKLQIKKYALSD